MGYALQGDMRGHEFARDRTGNNRVTPIVHQQGETRNIRGTSLFERLIHLQRIIKASLR